MFIDVTRMRAAIHYTHPHILIYLNNKIIRNSENDFQHVNIQNNFYLPESYTLLAVYYCLDFVVPAVKKIKLNFE